MTTDNVVNNGQMSDAGVADTLQEEVSVGYRPTLPLEALWSAGGGDIPQITLRRDIEFMQMHPVVSAAMDYYKSGIAGAEFWGGPDQQNPDNERGKPISLNQRVAQFVLAHVERFWQRGMPLLQEDGYTYGWAPGEHIYKEVDGMLVWSHLKAFHPRDGYILTLNHQSIGIRVKNVRDRIGGSVSGNYEHDGHDDDGYSNNGQGHESRPEPRGGVIDLWFASGNIPAKAAWYPHRPRFGQFYGRSQLTGAWRPWRRLGWRDAVEQIIDAAVYRAGYKGPVVRHPKEDMQTAREGVPGTQLDGRGAPRRSARDVARQMVEWAKAGAGFTLSSEQYPPAQGGGLKWDVEWPDHVMDVRPLIEAARYLEDQILLGIGVPPELVKAGGTGSGYSGRSIPREAFLDGQQRVADAMLQRFVEQVVKPLVIWNFGDIPFNIQAKSLLKTQADDKSGQQQGGGGQQQGAPDSLTRSQAAKDAWQIRKGSGNVGQPTPAPQPSAPMSLDPAQQQRILDIVRNVLLRRTG
jgi:hypothetical protein